MGRNDSREGPFQNPFHRGAQQASLSQRPQADIPGGGKTLVDSEPSSHESRHQTPAAQTEAEIGKEKGPALPVKKHRLAMKGTRQKFMLFNCISPWGNGPVREREGSGAGREAPEKGRDRMKLRQGDALSA